jgi:serine phosphatase RsbU (regulator of sigma subunit)
MPDGERAAQSRTRAAARAVTERATGILMERLGCPADVAREQLALLAAEAGTDPASVAADIAGERLPGGAGDQLPGPVARQSPKPAGEQPGKGSGERWPARAGEPQPEPAGELAGGAGGVPGGVPGRAGEPPGAARPSAGAGLSGGAGSSRAGRLPGVARSTGAARPPGLAGEARRATVRADAAGAAASDAASLAEALLAEALAAEGVTAVAIWALAPDGGIELAGEAGFGPREAAAWRRIPPGVPSLPLRAAADGTETWWPAGQPPGDGSFLIGAAAVARAVVPLWQAGRPVGALEACWPGAPADFPPAFRLQLPALAASCAQVLAAGLPVPDYAWPGPGAGGPGAANAGPGAGRSPGPDGGHGDSGNGRDGGRAAGTGDGPDGGLDDAGQGRARAASAPAGGAGPEAARDVERRAALLEAVQWLGNTGGWEEDLRTGAVYWTAGTFTLFGLPSAPAASGPVPLSALGPWVPPADLPAVESFRDRLLRRSEPATAAFRIVRADDGSVRQLRAFAEPVTGPDGEAAAIRGAYQDVSAAYHTQVAFSATREQLAGTEERARAERQLAVRLQQAITPEVSDLVEAAGIDVAARYRPAREEHLVGGDWYDVVLLPAGSVLLVVGDVAGHGIGAVTGMVALRNALRGLAVTGAGPAQLLAWLNVVALHLAGVMATAICAIYAPEARSLRWARAGHLPPLLVRDGIARAVSPPRGPLLGASPAATYEEATLALGCGDALLLFTDGLIERRGESLDDSLSQLARLASGHVTDVGQLASGLLERAGSDTSDDTCLVAISIR